MPPFSKRVEMTARKPSRERTDEKTVPTRPTNSFIAAIPHRIHVEYFFTTPRFENGLPAN